jgi:hypothetical protein
MHELMTKFTNKRMKVLEIVNLFFPLIKDALWNAT